MSAKSVQNFRENPANAPQTFGKKKKKKKKKNPETIARA